ncbi:MAG: TlpA family protein disulfide reductase, partial [Oscillospiraceae bacterium]|nr:TlpA family protein disulfide reductase [Oscillospiraceae bacterium]
PDFTFYHLDGSAANLSDYFGKPMVLNFWSSNCGPCRSEMPDFQRAYEELGDAVNFVMVNVTDGYWDTVDSASSYVAEEGFTFPVFYDTDNHAAYTYGITGLPTTFFLSAEGNLVAGRSGAMNYDILMGGIDLIHQ